MKKTIAMMVLLATMFLSMTAMAALPKDATMYWTPPTTNEDGSALTDLGGFKIYCGTSTGSYTTTVDIGPAPSNDYLISSDLVKDGTYYCAMTAYDTSGNESALSSEVTFPLDRTAPATTTGVGVK